MTEVSKSQNSATNPKATTHKRSSEKYSLEKEAKRSRLSQEVYELEAMEYDEKAKVEKICENEDSSSDSKSETPSESEDTSPENDSEGLFCEFLTFQTELSASSEEYVNLNYVYHSTTDDLEYVGLNSSFFFNLLSYD